MTRLVTVGAGQLGPIARDDTRHHVVERLITLLRDAASHGCDLVAFPELAPRRQVSTVSGVEPLWSPSGDELYFWEGPTLMSVPIADPDRLPTATARPVFTLSDRQMAGDPAYAEVLTASDWLSRRVR